MTIEQFEKPEKDEVTFRNVVNQSERNEEALNGLEASLNFVRSAKPIERGELARGYAVIITELEKTVAYFKVYILGRA